MKVGLAGCGAWGRLVLRDLIALDVEVIVADISDGARAAALALGASVVHDPTRLPVVDGLIVATPATSHAAVVSDLLPRGVPVLVEKPFTTSLADANRLLALGGNRLSVGHSWRYPPGVELLGDIARSGDIGRVLGVRSTRTNWTSPRTDIDAVWNLAPHDLTLAIEILGAIPTPRAASAEVHDGRALGLTALCGGAPWLVFDVSNRYRDKRRDVRVHGTDGVAVMTDPDSGRVEIAYGGPASRLSETETVERTFEGESALTRQLKSFLNFLQGGPPPKSSAAEGVDVVRCLEQLRDLAGLPPIS